MDNVARIREIAIYHISNLPFDLLRKVLSNLLNPLFPFGNPLVHININARRERENNFISLSKLVSRVCNRH